MNQAGALIVTKGKGGKKDYSSQANVLIYTALNLAGHKAAQAAGAEGSESTGGQSITLDALLEDAGKHKVGDLDLFDLNQEVSRFLGFLAQVVFLSDRGITDQLVPADSPLRKDWDRNGDGRIEVPPPPIALNTDADAWLAFHDALEAEGERVSPIALARLEILVRADHFVLQG